MAFWTNSSKIIIRNLHLFHFKQKAKLLIIKADLYKISKLNVMEVQGSKL